MSFALCAQFKPCDLGVRRTFWRKPAAIQKELAGGHGTKLNWRSFGQLLLQFRKYSIRLIALMPIWRSRTAAGARQSEVRAEGSLLFWNANLRQPIFYFPGQFCQSAASMNAYPENPRRPKRGKEPSLAVPEFNEPGFRSSKRLLNLFHHRLRPLANELQGHMQ